jgi:F-type H+-transporting ATPase subunit delta
MSSSVEVLKELRFIQEIYEGYPEVQLILESVTIGKTSKQEVARKIFSDTLHKEVMNFLFVLIDKGRMHAFDGIVHYFENLEYDREGMSDGIVVTATPLELTKLKEMEDSCSTFFREKIKLKNEIDPSVLGGAKILVEGQMIDMTLQARLRDMYAEMSERI